MVVGDDEIDAAQPAISERAQEPLQKGSASDGPLATPSTSRLPSVLMPTATITAVETIRPPSRPFR